MKKLLKSLVAIVLSVFCVSFAQAQHHRNNFSFSIAGPGYGFSINNGHHSSSNFYFGMPTQQPMMFVQPMPLIRQLQPVNLTTCSNNIYMDVDQFRNQISPQYRICWNVDQFGNQISPQYRRY